MLFFTVFLLTYYLQILPLKKKYFYVNIYYDIQMKGLDVMNKIKNIIKLNYLKNLLHNLDKTDLKIMKLGLKICFSILLFSVLILSFYLTTNHKFFLYELGITIFRVSTYIAVEFIVCGIVVDTLKKNII